MLGRLIRFITWPFRLVGRLSRTVARETKSSSRTAANASGSIVAGALGDDLLDEEYREEPPTGIETVLFKQLPRPRFANALAPSSGLPGAPVSEAVTFMSSKVTSPGAISPASTASGWTTSVTAQTAPARMRLMLFSSKLSDRRGGPLLHFRR